MNLQQHQTRLDNARLQILRQDLLAPVLSIEGHAEMLTDLIADTVCNEDLQKIVTAATQTRQLIDEMLGMETKALTDEDREQQRQRFKHDLRNSVGAISGYSEIILEDLDDEGLLTEESQTYLEHQLSDAGKLLEMLDTLFQAEQQFGEDSNAALSIDIEAVYKSFDRSDKERTAVIKGRILVVDDNDSNRNLLVHQLNRQGHEVSESPSGALALEMIHGSKPDLILLDLFMPDMNGFDVLREMHKDENLRAIPVIIITGLSDQNAAIKCIEAGAFDLLIKPVKPALLAARVSACLERKGWHDKEKAYQQELEKSYTFIRKVFGRYLSDEVVQQILESDRGMQMGGGKQEVTIMMTDIRGFSMLSQEIDAQDCVKMLNNYFGIMVPLIQKYDGVVDEFLGDAILAIFGAPVISDDHAQQAVACALEMQLAMTEVNLNNKKMGLPSLEMGIAVNTGEVVVGNIGSETRSKYGVVGHHVNLTARIESFTVGGQVMASEYTIAALKTDVTIANSMDVDAKGIKNPVRIQEVTGIGAPYNIELMPNQQEPKALLNNLPVFFSRLTGTAVANEAVEGYLLAAAEGIAHLATGADLKLLSNLRMHIPGYPGSEDDQTFSKVTAVLDSKNGHYHYVIKLTSTPLAVRKFLDTQIANQ